MNYGVYLTCEIEIILSKLVRDTRITKVEIVARYDNLGDAQNKQNELSK